MNRIVVSGGQAMLGAPVSQLAYLGFQLSRIASEASQRRWALSGSSA
jgi:hypothetical protein